MRNATSKINPAIYLSLLIYRRLLMWRLGNLVHPQLRLRISQAHICDSKITRQMNFLQEALLSRGNHDMHSKLNIACDRRLRAADEWVKRVFNSSMVASELNHGCALSIILAAHISLSLNFVPPKLR